MSWASGYLADIGYTFGYYTELNPLRVNLAFLNTGLVCPQIHTACELGYGQGLSANLHAAASNTQWWGWKQRCTRQKSILNQITVPYAQGTVGSDPTQRRPIPVQGTQSPWPGR